MHLAAGLSVGLSGVAAGYTIGIVGDAVWIPLDSFLGLCPGDNELTAVSGRPGLHATISGLRGHDSDSDFWRSSRSVRVSHGKRLVQTNALVLC
jgi:hypothetical protein